MSQARFQKMQREKVRREKAQAKAERKAVRAEEAEKAAEQGDATPEAPEGDVLEALARLHAQFDDDQIDFETFEERKQELISRLSV
jgi:hypothetical protein